MSGTNEPAAIDNPPWLDVFIETPKGSFLKRGWTGDIDFISPFPCPFNYGSVDGYLGLEGDMLDAVVLGPRLRRGSRVRVRAFGAVGLTDHGMYDDKLICSPQAVSPVHYYYIDGASLLACGQGSIAPPRPALPAAP